MGDLLHVDGDSHALGHAVKLVGRSESPEAGGEGRRDSASPGKSHRELWSDIRRGQGGRSMGVNYTYGAASAKGESAADALNFGSDDFSFGLQRRRR